VNALAKGIDIFRVYETVTDWSQVRDSGVEFCWAKASDGLRIAFDNDPNRTPRPADPTVAGTRSVGIAPGLYHWGKGNAPEDEADFFAAEVIRLGCRGDGALPPALDAEDAAIGVTWAARRDWCIRFLRRLQERIGQDRVAVYMSASWAAALRPDQWDIPGLVLWIAAYGSNNGTRSIWAITQLYDGRVDVHQYTSLGVHLVDGITAQGLDVNESNIPLDQLLGGDDVGVVTGFSDDGFVELMYNRKVSTPDPENAPDYQLGLGQLLEGAWRGAQLVESAVVPMLAQIAADPNVTADALRQIVQDAARTAGAEQGRVVAEALGARINDLVTAALKQVQDADNLDEAKQTATELLKQLRAALGGNAGQA
jgi:GH25 family lysozyme M1 (1,4-beta-N-acetylmuramidase)